MKAIIHLSATLLLSAFLIACDSGSETDSNTSGGISSGDTSGGTVSTTGGEATINNGFTADEQPVAIQDLITPVENNKRSVVVTNANGEIELNSSDSAQGWATLGNCGNGDISLQAGGGKRDFLTLSSGCTLTQNSQEPIIDSHAVSLQFELSVDKALATNLDNPTISFIAEILGVSDTGDVQVLKTQTIPMAASAIDWQRQQVLINFNELTLSNNTTVGVRFKAAGDVDMRWYLSDVALDVFDKNQNAGIQFNDDWASVCNQIWAGSSYWANRNRDWNVADGRLQARNGSLYRPLRTVHRITSYMSATPENFKLSVQTGVVDNASGNAFAGILFGAGNGLDYRAAALVHNRSGRNGGLIAGVYPDGRVFLHDNGISDAQLAIGSASARTNAGVKLSVSGEYTDDSVYRLTATTTNVNGELLSSASTDVPAHRMLGNIGLVSNPGPSNANHWFNQFQGTGGKLVEVSAREFGPVQMATYTVSRNTLTLNAQFPQMCVDKFEAPTLAIMREGEWVEVAIANIDPAAYTSRFSVSNWDSSEEAIYRVGLKASTSNSEHYYYGTVQAEPANDDEFILTTYNCRPGVILSDTEGWIQQNNFKPFTWSEERITYPHSELMTNAAKHNSHMLAFLGDQIYEFDPNGFIDKENTEVLIEDYFWKWQQFVFTVREYTRNTPSFIIPDDHDVYQGNVWGANGRPAANEGEGGFVYASEFVEIVQKTQTGSLPRSNDTAPVEQGIGVYFTDIVYGGIGMAILEDRKFKSSPGSPEATALLLGERQLSFLDTWARDWDKQQLKITVSQSPFAQGTTHSGANAKPNTADRDTNGWPAIGRNKALTALRKALSPHVNGDQHLGMSLKHGINEPSDAVHSFAGPSMLNIFPRVWDPANTAPGPGVRSTAFQGEYTDFHGNLMNVLAVANPDTYYLQKPDNVWQKDQLGIGYGVVRMNKPARTYEFAAWPANVDPNSMNATPYEGWPIEVNQTDNDGRTPVAFLEQRIAPVNEPVVMVINEATDELVYARRYNTTAVELPVYDSSATYRVVISDDATGYVETFSGQTVAP